MPHGLMAYAGIFAFLVLAGSIVIWVRALKRVEIPEKRTRFVIAWALAAVIGLLALTAPEGTLLLRIPTWIAVIVSLFLLFLVSISRQKVGDNAIRVGDKIPHFTALDEFGEQFDSRNVADHLLLIKFFRAHW